MTEQSAPTIDESRPDPTENEHRYEPADAEHRYDPTAAQQRWQAYWAEHQTFVPADDDSAERRYVLDMFPYPSGDLHMGHAEAFVMGDIVARHLKLQGFDVLHPIGWDSFGLPAENAAIKNNTHPAEWTYANIETQATSFQRYGLSFDWNRRLHTSDPEYYRWTQWLFLKFRERGLAYRKASYVNWCPNDQTVLANEQVVNGACERCGAVVTKRQLTQWYFKTTEYAQRLLDDMAELEGGWPERVLAMQRNWIGRSEGAYVDFEIDGYAEPVTVFTTRPDTLYGATFFVVAPEGELAAQVVADEQKAAFEAYLEQAKLATEIERQATDRPKTGVFLGVYATNPVNNERIPVYAADYVLADYGTGAVMAVPAHDQRDLDFARTYGLPVIEVISTGQPDPAESGIATPGDGTYVNSGPLDGLTDKATGVSTIIGQLEEG
ncbi:MAG TPA: class I tRNA ligase family protein, partial [Microlunatus sp.]|nr:class I tRNA ligase family protein [Microlunatus sp.]